MGNFFSCLNVTLAKEGGYTNNPHDPGGPTNYGITINDLKECGAGNLATPQAIQELSVLEAGRIYRKLYWERINGDNLPAGLDLAVFDYAVNSGVFHAAFEFQDLVNYYSFCAMDGVIGPKTIAAIPVELSEHIKLINDICDSRITYLRSLTTFQYFGNGWTARVEQVREAAIAMTHVCEPSPPPPPTVPSPKNIPWPIPDQKHPWWAFWKAE